MPHPRVSKKPVGQPTRGKTAPNRLRRVDNFILLYEPSLLTRTDGLFSNSLFVDLGYGFDARTTLESATRFRRLNPDLKIMGVEIDRERVEAALPFADDRTFFRLGGFNLPLLQGEYVRLIRAFNVLRQYEEKDFAPACERLAENVLPGGLMIEGTSNPFGSIWCANVVRRTTEADNSLPVVPSVQELAPGLHHWRHEALVFSTNFRLGFDVEEFQTILPKNLIHHVVKGEPIFDFFEAWKAAAAESSAMKNYGARQWFIAAAERMTERGHAIATQRKWLARGFLIWKLEPS
jgi:hypothetical protein